MTIDDTPLPSHHEEVARVHAAERRTDHVGPITFEAAVEDVRRRGFRLRSTAEAHVHRVAVLTP